MKTIHLSDEGHAEIAAALEVVGQRLAAAGEQARFDQLAVAVFEFYGWSSWRSNGVRAFPAGSVFAPGAAKPSACAVVVH